MPFEPFVKTTGFGPRWSCRPDGLGARDRQWKVLMAADQEALRPTRGVVGIDGEFARAFQQRGQHGAGLDAGERGSDTVVDAVPEGQVATRGTATEVHGVRVVELC